MTGPVIQLTESVGKNELKVEWNPLSYNCSITNGCRVIRQDKVAVLLIDFDLIEKPYTYSVFTENKDGKRFYHVITVYTEEVQN